jgi:hypothetical protein
VRTEAAKGIEMGWKAFKEKFGIEHIVQVTTEGVCIGSPYVHDLAIVDPKTGEIRDNQVFPHFVRKTYPRLAEAAPAEIVKILEAPDTFASSIAVYTYGDGDVVEKLCEEPGWPNVTHDGHVMYENMFSTDQTEVVGWAKRNAAAGASRMRERIAEVEAELVDLKARLAGYEADQARLEASYPDPA